MASENKNQCENCKCRVPITLRDFFWQDPFFSTNWDDFHGLHDMMLKETKNFWEKFDSKMKGIEKKEETTENKTNSDEFVLLGLPRKLMRLPSIFNEEASKDSVSREDQTIKLKDDEKAFEVSLDTHNFRPDEIKVAVENKMITVQGKHEEKSEDGNRYVSRQFIRKYTLPKDCPPEQVVSNLSADGVLLVTAPKQAAAVENHNRAVPIQMEKK